MQVGTECAWFDRQTQFNTNERLLFDPASRDPYTGVYGEKKRVATCGCKRADE